MPTVTLATLKAWKSAGLSIRLMRYVYGPRGKRIGAIVRVS